MTILLSDPRVAAVRVHDCAEPLVRLAPVFGTARALVRAGLAGRLEQAREALPPGIGLRLVEGHRTVADQRAILARYECEVRAAHPRANEAAVRRLTNRFVAPVEVAPHVAGAAVDLTLVNYPTEWWHWSFGDRYWALRTGLAAMYGPVAVAVAS